MSLTTYEDAVREFVAATKDKHPATMSNPKAQVRKLSRRIRGLLTLLSVHDDMYRLDVRLVEEHFRDCSRRMRLIFAFMEANSKKSKKR
jgi:hypothetical protein